MADNVSITRARAAVAATDRSDYILTPPQTFRTIALMFPFLLALPVLAQDRGAFAYLTPLPGIVAEAVDQSGNLYVTGQSVAGVNATSGAFHSQPQRCAVYAAGCPLVYVAKLDPSGNLVYLAALGGGDIQNATAIAVDPAGNAIITGYTYAADFPVTPGAAQTNFGGGGYSVSPDGGVFAGNGGDAFVTKLNSAGSALIFSTFIGGSGEDGPNAITLDQSGNIYIGGQTSSSNFPVTAGAWGQQLDGTQSYNGFVTKLKADGSRFTFSSYFSFPVNSLALGTDGAVYFTGTVSNTYQTFPATPGAFRTQLSGYSDAYAAKFSADGTQLNLATLLGGSGQDTGSSIAVSGSGTILVGGQSGSNDFPVVNAPAIAAGQSFLAGIAPDGSALVSSYSPGGDGVRKIAMQADGSFWLFGYAFNNPVPLTQDAFEKGTTGAFAQHRGGTNSLLYSTTIREGAALALDSNGNVYIGAGVALAAGKIDFSLVSTASVIANVMNAGTFDSYAITPGEVVAIFGDRIGPAFGVVYSPDSQGLAPRSLGGVSVLFNGTPAPLIYAQGSQVNAIVPWGLTGLTASVVVQYNGAVSSPFNAAISNSVPGVFEIPGTPGAPKQAAAINQDETTNSPANPAPLGSIVSIYVTGLGPEMRVPADGSVTPDASYLAVNPITVMFGDVSGHVLYAGGAPQLLAGVSQINVQLPHSIPGASNLSAVPILIRSGGGLLSNVGPTIAVQ